METQSKQRIPIFAAAQAKLGFVQKGGGVGGREGRGATGIPHLRRTKVQHNYRLIVA